MNSYRGKQRRPSGIGCLGNKRQRGDSEFQEWSLNLFRDFEEGNFTPVVSTLVALEIQNGPQEVKDKFNQLLDMKHIFLEPDKEIQDLADLHLKRSIVTQRFSDDALHIALATVNNINMVVSWNFKHIVHYDKIRKFNAVNTEYGYKQIEIYSPREVTSYGES